MLVYTIDHLSILSDELCMFHSNMKSRNDHRPNMGTCDRRSASNRFSLQALYDSVYFIIFI